MKSLALNFIVIFPLLLFIVSALAARTTTVTVKPTQTTTTQRPSLRAPQPTQATTPAITLTKSTTTTTANRRANLRAHARGATHSATSSLSAAANIVTTKSPITSTAATTTTTTTESLTKRRQRAQIARQQQHQQHQQQQQQQQLSSSLAHAKTNAKTTTTKTPTRTGRLVHKSDAATTGTSADTANTNNNNNSSSNKSLKNSNNSMRQYRSLNIGKSSSNSNQLEPQSAKHENLTLNTPQDRHHSLGRQRLRTNSYDTTSTSAVTNSSTTSSSSSITSKQHQLMSGFMNNNNNNDNNASNNNNNNNNNITNNNNNNINKRQQSQSSMATWLPLDNGDSAANDSLASRRFAAHAPQYATTTTTTTHTTNSSDIVKLPQTLKTPRMIQRLAAGHIQNARGRSTYEISSYSTTATVSISSTEPPPAPTLAYNQLRRRQPLMSSSYSQANIDAAAKTTTTTATTTTKRHISSTTIKPTESLEAENAISDERDDDEALLDEPGDFDNWDNGILRLSAGAGKENSLQKSKKNKEDSKKTLADQVRDGKYGLIEKELFQQKPKRPGVLSYLPNKEVPYDNEHNFGGLNEEDIWLAEDHLLVIKGGSLNEAEANEPWAPIDDYDAPSRPIKIPTKPKVPPPFPVQLEPNGPVQLIGNNKFTVVYPIANETIPIYTTGPETKHPTAESDSDDKKNLIARPGQSEDSKEDGETPAYIYPAPYPPWLYHNQTFVNPLLKKARPIAFPVLGPFPFTRNGTQDGAANADTELDEDDPALYYPPAYSFVYKNSYKNAVAPGPLVPGIVLPPPPHQFSRLEEHERPLVHRQRYQPTTSSTTTTTTPLPTTTTTTTARPSTTPSTTSSTSTTTTSTTPAPFRHTITKISEYIPKTIVITPSPPQQVTTPTPPPTPSTTYAPPSYEPIPVPVAVPVPIYPVNYQPTPRPQIVTFVPTTPEPSTGNVFSKSNPIYYEYFEAKRQPSSTPNVIDEFLATTARPPQTPPPKPIKLHASSKRPHKGQYGYRAGYAQKPHHRRPIVDDNIVYITPKPIVSLPKYKPRPLEFESEVNAIRETLRYYKNQQLRDNNIPRAPKSKPIYEYSFDATKNIQQPPQQQQQTLVEQNFQEPAPYDEEPFRPMVTYSPSVDDENAFKAIAYDKADNEVVSQQPQQPRKYQSTTTLVPVRKEGEFRGRPKKLRKYYPAEQQQPEANYPTTARTVLTTEAPWVSIDSQQQQQEQQADGYRSERLQMPETQYIEPPQNRGFNGYYYQPPPPPPQYPQQRPSSNSRQNNRYYSEPFQQPPPQRKIVNYRPQAPPPLQQQQQQQQWSLENDTYVNYLPNRPPLNPDAEFITPYQSVPVENYPYNPQRLPPPPPPPQYYAQPPPLPQYQPQFQQQQQQQQQPPPFQAPLHRDILVNYRQPLPPINPDSEYINHPQVVRNQPILGPGPYYQRQAHAYRVRPIDSGGGGPNVYYVTPKYRRANNNNQQQNNNNNNNIVNQANNNNSS